MNVIDRIIGTSARIVIIPPDAEEQVKSIDGFVFSIGDKKEPTILEDIPSILIGMLGDIFVYVSRYLPSGTMKYYT